MFNIVIRSSNTAVDKMSPRSVSEFVGVSDASQGATYLQQEVRGIVDAHHQASYPHHVVDVRKADETHRSQVMDEHDEEVLHGKDGQYLLLMQHTAFGGRSPFASSLCKYRHSC